MENKLIQRKKNGTSRTYWKEETYWYKMLIETWIFTWCYLIFEIDKNRGWNWEQNEEDGGLEKGKVEGRKMSNDAICFLTTSNIHLLSFILGTW